MSSTCCTYPDAAAVAATMRSGMPWLQRS
jgi:hypothetical protein